MSDIELDLVTNDMKLTGGDISIVTLDAAIRQRLLQTLRLFLGEWFLDTSAGVPYYQSILVKNPNLDVVQASIKNAILSTPGITELLSFNFNYDAVQRKVTMDFDAKSTNGTTITVRSFEEGGI
jgi:hypothetical protein